MATTSMDIINEPFVREQSAIEAALRDIMEAVRAKDFERLAAYHLDSPKFSKFDDFEPLDRQDVATARQAEEEGLGGVENFNYDVEDLKVDVFEHVGIATFVFNYRFEAGGGPMAQRARTTLVFVNDGGSWKIAHEHLSAFKSSA